MIRSLQPLDLLFAEWIASLEGVLDERTVETYKTTYVAKHFLTHFKDLADVCDEEKVGDYFRDRLRVVLRVTLRKEKSALWGFVKWCKEKNAIGELPVWPELPSRSKGKRAGKQRAEANELSPAQVETFIAMLPVWSERSKKGKHFAVRARFRFAYETGLRPATLNAIRWGDVSGVMLTIQDENDKARFGRQVPLSDAALAALASIAPEPRSPGALIFGRHDYRTAIRKACELAKIDLALAPYDFRHARGTHLVDDGAPLTAVAHLFGHTQLTTTNKYAKANLRAAEAAVRAVRAPLLLPPGPPPAPASPPAADAPSASDSGAVLDLLGEALVRRTGLEPVQELPHWNLKPTSEEKSNQKAAENALTRDGEEPHETARNRLKPDRTGSLHQNFDPALARKIQRYVASEWAGSWGLS